MPPISWWPWLLFTLLFSTKYVQFVRSYFYVEDRDPMDESYYPHTCIGKMLVSDEVGIFENDPVGRIKVFVYELPSIYNKDILDRHPHCLNNVFSAAEIHMHQFLLSSPVRTHNPNRADWFFVPVYSACGKLPSRGHPYVLRNAIEFISCKWPYWNESNGSDHFFFLSSDFGSGDFLKSVESEILRLRRHATLVHSLGQWNHECMVNGSITVPPYAPSDELQSYFIGANTPKDIFVYFGYLENKSEVAYGERATLLEKSPLIGTSILSTADRSYYENMQKATYCLCPLGWEPWGPRRLVDAVMFGCIPVVISEKENVLLPFGDAIPWDDIVKFVMDLEVIADPLVLDSIFNSILPEETLRKQQLLANPLLKKAMLYGQPAQTGDAFHQLLNGLARRWPRKIFEDSPIFIKYDNV